MEICAEQGNEKLRSMSGPFCYRGDLLHPCLLDLSNLSFVERCTTVVGTY